MKHLAPKEFYSQVSKWANGKRLCIAEKWCNAVVEVIIYECFYKHGCKVPLLGNFELIHHPEKTQTQNKNGEVNTFIVPEHFSVKFIPCDSFINDVNGKGVTKLYRKRVKDNKITKRDIERQLKFEQNKIDKLLQEQYEDKLSGPENKKKPKKNKQNLTKEEVNANGQKK